MDNEAADEVSVEHITTSDVSAVESVCEEIGFVMRANNSSRLVNAVVSVIFIFLNYQLSLDCIHQLHICCKFM